MVMSFFPFIRLSIDESHAACAPRRSLAQTQAAATRRYHSHLENVIALGAEPHLNTCFKHFMYFITEFSLIERKELEPLKEICAGLGMPLGPLK